MIETIGLFPLFIAENLDALKDFYIAVFGYEAVFYDSSFYLHLLNPENGNQLAFMLPNHPSQPELLHHAAATEGIVITLEVENASVAFQQAQEMKLDIVFELKKEPWGQTHFMIQDPAKFVIDIVEHN